MKYSYMFGDNQQMTYNLGKAADITALANLVVTALLFSTTYFGVSTYQIVLLSDEAIHSNFL